MIRVTLYKINGLRFKPHQHLNLESGQPMNRLLFIFLILLGTQNIQGNSDAVDILIKNKDVFINKLLSCSASICDLREQRDTLIKLLQLKNIKNNEKEKLIRLYFHYYRAIIYATSSGFLLSDSINFDIVIKALQSSNSQIAIRAHDILLGLSDIVQLRRYNNSIKQALIHASRINPDQKVRLLALATDSIKSNDNKNDTSALVNAVRKYMLDTTFENKRIAALDTSKIFYEKLWAINDLIFRGSSRSLKALILHFNEPLFEMSSRSGNFPPCTTRTLRIPIIEGLSRFFPDEPLLNDSLHSLMNDPGKMQDREQVSLYFTRFLQWAKKEFGIEPVDPTLPPIINQGCRPGP